MVSAPADIAPRDREAVLTLLEEVTDPEIPVLTLGDLGVVRDAEVGADGAVTVTITPTYSGCPAMTTMEIDIRDRLMRAGAREVTVKTVLSPAWTTDWMTENGRAKLEAYGIAPPVGKAGGRATLFGEDPSVRCPQCTSEETEKVSEFGSTACKAHYRCKSCGEPFDYFKCI